MSRPHRPIADARRGKGLPCERVRTRTYVEEDDKSKATIAAFDAIADELR